MSPSDRRQTAASPMQVFTRHQINKIFPYKSTSPATRVFYVRWHGRKKRQFPSWLSVCSEKSARLPLDRLQGNFVSETYKYI